MATKGQFEMLRNIARSEYQPRNGAEPETFDDLDWIWAEMIIETAEDKGTFTSLVNAGLAEHNGAEDDEACVRLTEAGLDAYKQGA